MFSGGLAEPAGHPVRGEPGEAEAQHGAGHKRERGTHMNFTFLVIKTKFQRVCRGCPPI